MEDFDYRRGALCAGELPLAQIAAEFGTPTYVYSRQGIERRFLDWQNALAGRPHLICYAVKANSNIGVLNLLARLGAGFDIVSGGELERVLAAGAAANRVVFSGVGKTRQEIARALAAGIRCFNVESAPELERINDVAAERGDIAPVSLRVNPDVDAATHPYISTGLKNNKFGIDINDAFDVYQRANALPHIAVHGVDCHIGSQLTDTAPFIAALDRVLVLVDKLAGAGIKLQHLDLGGGLGVRYRDEQPPAVADYLGEVLQRLGDRELELMFEPGRSIVAEAGALLMKVEFLKPGSDKNFAIVDAAMNDMMRPALYQAWMRVLPLKESSSAAPMLWDVVGPVCESGDFLAEGRELALREGDLLALMGSGAYGFSMSSNYNSRFRAAEVVVDGASAHLVRSRETIADLMRGESVLPDAAAT